MVKIEKAVYGTGQYCIDHEYKISGKYDALYVLWGVDAIDGVKRRIFAKHFILWDTIPGGGWRAGRRGTLASAGEVPGKFLTLNHSDDLAVFLFRDWNHMEK